MLDKLLIRQYYEKGIGYQDIALRFGVSRQRIHQIVKNYRTIGTSSKKINELLLRGCFCGERADVFHHKDGNTHNNTKENLIPYCTKHHIEVHVKLRKVKNYDFKCPVCGKNDFTKFDVAQLRKGTIKCANCTSIANFHKRNPDAGYHRRSHQISKECAYCFKEFTESNPHHSKDMHATCYYNFEYKTNPQRREKQKLLMQKLSKKYRKTPQYKAYQKAYRQTPKYKAKKNEWLEKNKERINAKFRDRYRNDPEFRMKNKIATKRAYLKRQASMIQ